MSEMTLTIDARMIDDSGIGTYLKNLLPYVLEVFTVRLLGNRAKLHRYSKRPNCQIIDFNAPLYSLKEQLLLPFIVPKTDVFWAPHFNTPILPIRAKHRITTIHDVNHLSEITSLSRLKKKYSRILYENALRRSSKIITVSNFSKKEILKYTDESPSKIKVIYCGVSEDFKTCKPLITELPTRYVLFVGNVKPHKNLITLLKAYSSLTKQLQGEVKLVVLGKKTGFITPDKHIFEFIDTMNLTSAVYFTDYVKDKFVPSIYKNAELLVFPSMYEGFGLPLIEAMAVGTPVLSSNAGSLPEIGGLAVRYFDPLNVEDLASQLEQFLTDTGLQKQYVEKGLEHMKKFCWKKSAHEHIKVLSQQ